MEQSRIKRFATKEVIAAFAAGLGLLAYVVFLLLSNYRSEISLHNNLIELQREETSQRARELNYFLADRKEDLANLALSRETAVFFENKALGMSMEYGLGQSLLALRGSFVSLMERKRMGRDALYARLAFIDREGRPLVDTSPAISSVRDKTRRELPAAGKSREGIFLPSGDGREIIVSVPYLFKGVYEGQVVGWVDLRVIYRHILGKQPSPGSSTFIASRDSRHYLGLPSSDTLSVPDLISVEAGKVHAFSAKEKGGPVEMFAMRLHVGDLPFCLVHVFPAADVRGRLAPTGQLVGLGIVAAGIFGGLVFVFTANIRSLILRARLNESASREKVIQEKNSLLQKEVEERKLAEQKTQESKKRYRDLAELLPQGVFEADREGRLTFVNRFVLQSLGYSMEECLAGLNILDIVSPEDRVFAETNLRRVISGEPSSGNEYRLVRKDGSRFSVMAYTAPVIHEGEVAGLRGVIADITELKETEERYRIAIEYSNDGIAINYDDVHVYVNQKFVEMFGYTSQYELIGQPLSLTIHPDDREMVLSYARARRAGMPAPSRYEFKGIRRDGTPVYIETSVTTITYHGQKMALTQRRDITERRRTEQALKERESYLKTILDSVQTGVFVVDSETHVIVDVNAVASKLVGAPKEELVGNVRHVFVCPAEHGRCPVTDLGQTLDNAERALFHRSGRRIPIIKSVVPVTINGRKCLLESFVDISAQKEAQEELKRAKESAVAANRSKSEFLANMSHEIRTPMNGVVGFTDMLLDAGLNDEQTEYARTIKRSGETLLSLIDDILDLSKIEAGQLNLEEIEFDPELVCYDVCDLVRPKLGERPVELLCRMGDEVPAYVRGDPARFRQILLNLVGNAAKFTKSGEIEIALNAEEQEDGGLRLRARLRDTGIGIQKEKLEAIFEPFQQADSSTTRQYGGTGLGLAISRRLAAIMGGDIRAESEPGKGSTFHFEAMLGKSDMKRDRPLYEVSLASRRTLIVDDNRTGLDILRHMLSSRGLSVTACVSGSDALREMKEAGASGNPFDICLIDIKMPEMDGYELARLIREDPAQFGAPLLVAFSSSAIFGSKKSAQAWFDGFLPKPVRRDRLIELVTHLFGSEGAEKTGGLKEVLAPPHSPREAVKQPVCILLVEDNPVNQKLAGIMLDKGGFKVEVAGNGREGAERFTSDPDKFDLIFMDIQMPEMDGYEATRLIREKGFGGVPIIALTAHAMKGEREKCLGYGMDDYITKPIKREIVFEKIRSWVLERRNGEDGGSLLKESGR